MVRQLLDKSQKLVRIDEKSFEDAVHRFFFDDLQTILPLIAHLMTIFYDIVSTFLQHH
jgi:hypothetical protein